MREIKVEETLGEELATLQGEAVVVDAQGRALGFFSPLDRPTDLEEMQLDPPLSIAEVEELRKVKTGKPLVEILNRLGIR